MPKNKNMKTFKKFSEMKKGTKKAKDDGINYSNEIPKNDTDRPMYPNKPNDSEKVEKYKSRKNIIPKEQNVKHSSQDDKVNTVVNDGKKSKSDKKTNENVNFYGKVAKFPKRVKASNAYNFLEGIKIPKKSIWYILLEKQENELQMLKYNNKQGVNMDKFVKELKSYYLKKYSHKPKLVHLIENIELKGKEEFSVIRNIPNIKIEKNKKLVTQITEDLIKLLS